MLSGPLTATIFGYGEFGARDVQMSAYALMAYSLGLVGFSLVKVLAPGYFARQDTKTPVKVGIVALGTNMGFNLAVVVPAHFAGFVAPHALLALSTGLSACLNSFLLYRGLRRQAVYQPSSRWGWLWPRVLAANGGMAAFLWWASGDWSSWPAMATSERALRAAACVAGGGAAYFALLWVAGLRPADFRSGAAR
jgi:putative peptidoglycan lipid II flippase